MNYRWNWGILLEEPYWGWLWSGLGWTIAISITSWCLALAIGIGVGIAGAMPMRWSRRLAAGFVNVFRNIPPLVQLFMWFFVVPELLPDAVGLWLKRDLPFPEFSTAVFAIGLFSGARVAEQVKAGIDAVAIRLLPPALATGLRPLQAFRLILLPLGLRAVVKPLTSEALITMKLSAMSLTIGVLEMTAESRHVENYTFQGFEAFTVATVVYILLGLLITAVMLTIDGRVNAYRQEPRR
jgi:glutamate/aspartate transport system permease protein